VAVPSASRLKVLARRAVKPVTSPIDGRVADINRRVSHVQSATEGLHGQLDVVAAAVGGYATAATETSSYLGVELRRIEEVMQGLVDEIQGRWLEDYYRERLRHAIDLPPEKLDIALAGLLNHATQAAGYAAQSNLWFNEPLWIEHREGEVALIGVNERIVEVPFATAALARIAPPAAILDIGSAESTFPLSAASLGYRVTAVEPRGLPYSHPNLEVVARRFEQLEAAPGSFQAVFLISTIEHVGLPAYELEPFGAGDPGHGADRELINRVGELLTDDGVLVLTTPYGPAGVDTFQRVYDNASLNRLLDGWEVEERREMTRHDDLVWMPATADDDQGTVGVVMVVARPPRS
jgi:hypothetical protein